MLAFWPLVISRLRKAHQSPEVSLRKSHCMSLYCALSLHSSKKQTWGCGQGPSGAGDMNFPSPLYALVSDSHLSEPMVPQLLNGDNSISLEFLGFNEKTRPGVKA